jgi:hypothetical protein
VTPDQPQAKKRKGLLAFYVGTGVVALLIVGFYFARTPLKLWYLQHKAMGILGDSTPKGTRDPYWDDYLPCVREIVEVGPAAVPALCRVIKAVPHDTNRAYVIDFVQIEDSRDMLRMRTWLLEVFYVMARDDKSRFVQLKAIVRAESVARRSFAPPDSKSYSEKAHLDFSRKNFLDWWEREGKAKYGSSR